MELDFVAWLRERTPTAPNVVVGIGDDAAVVDLGSSRLVTTTDLLIDGVHFRTEEHTPDQIGRKALAVNLSDLAAMAARPVGAVVSFALPRQAASESRDAARGLATEDLAKRLIDGMAPLAAEFACPIVGGDTNTGPGPLVVSVTAFGEPTEHGLVRRNGARAGDTLLVTGPLGGSLLGKHLDFTPRVAESLRIVGSGLEVTAMMDLSDGLALDLRRLCEASGVGAVIDADAVPTSREAEAMATQTGRTAFDHALSDGEDFELLLAARFDRADETASRLVDDEGLIPIGGIVAQPGVTVRHGDGSHEAARRQRLRAPMTQTIEIASEAETVALGAKLAAALRPPAVVSLIGPLGAGKTRLVQAVAEALGVAEEVTSPTFVLINEYRTGRLPIYHLDAYRLNDEDEFLELGVDEYFAGAGAAGPGFVFIEWGDRFPDCLPPTAVTIRIEPLEAEARRVELTGLQLTD